jgi:Spy/CpxP family protein refolding chaperone
VFTKRVLCGFLVALLAASVVVGQTKPASAKPVAADQGRGGQRDGGPPRDPQRGKWWQDEKYKADLKLTAEQSARIEEIWQAALSKAKPVMDEFNRRVDVLSNLINGSNDVTEAQVLKAADQVETMRSDMSKSRTLMLFRMRRILSPEQRAKLASIEKERERPRAPGDRGRAPEMR